MNMAERRMFAKTIIDSDAFIDMPLSAQALYFHLSMRADDEGFINNPKKIQRMIGASDDDAKLLIAKKFVIPFESGVVVIKHWKIHNYIRGDRKKQTMYPEERAQLTEKSNGAYALKTDLQEDLDGHLTVNCPSNVSQLPETCQHRLGKVSIGKESIEDIYSAPEPDAPPTPSEPKEPKNKRFVKPTVSEIEKYCKSRGNSVNAQRFFDYYESNGWKVGKNPMKDWKAAVRTWERNEGGSRNGDGKYRTGIEEHSGPERVLGTLL